MLNIYFSGINFGLSSPFEDSNWKMHFHFGKLSLIIWKRMLDMDDRKGTRFLMGCTNFFYFFKRFCINHIFYLCLFNNAWATVFKKCILDCTLRSVICLLDILSYPSLILTLYTNTCCVSIFFEYFDFRIL